MKKIALISDQHFDQSSRWEEHLRIMEWIASDIERRGDIDLIALGGDLFERRPNPTETDAAANWLVRLGNIAEVVGVYGNHDVPLSLDPFNLLESKHPIRFYSKPAVHRAQCGAYLACLPWPNRAALLRSIGHAASREEANQVALEALQGILRGFGAELDAEVAEEPGAPRIFLGHCMMRASVLSTGQPIVPGCDFEIGTSDLALVRAHAYLLGHIHCGGETNLWEIDGAPCFYPGSPRRTSFGEIESKHYAIVTADGDVADVDFVETPAAQMLLVEDVWRDGGFQKVPDMNTDQFRGAEVRFRYSVASDERVAAKQIARTIVEGFEEFGAVAVKVEEVVIPVLRARAPEITTARTMEAKLATLWKSRGTIPDKARAWRLMQKLDLLEDAARDAGAPASHIDGGVRFSSLRTKDMGVFRGETFIDFDSLPGPLIALTGKNGAGKSTALELLLGAAYRKCPTRGTLASLALARDSFTEVNLVSDAPWKIRQSIDAISGNGEAFVTNASGAAVLTSTLVSEFDTWAKSHLPAKSLLLASTFAAQKTKGFVEIGEADRKDVILRALGIERIQLLAKDASKRASAAKTTLTTTNALIAEERARGGDPAAIAADLDARNRKAAEMRAAVEKERIHLEALREVHAAWKIANAKIVSLQADLKTNARTREDLQGRIENNRALITDAESIRAAKVRAERHDAEAGMCRRALDLAVDELAEVEKKLAALQADWRSADDRAHALESTIASHQSRLAGHAAAKEAAEKLPDLEQKEAAKASAVTALMSEIEDLRATVQDISEHRIDYLQTSLKHIDEDCETIDDAKLTARQGLTEDRDRGMKIATTPGALVTKRAELKEMESQHRNWKHLADTARSLSASLPMLDRGAAELVAAQASLIEAKSKRESIAADLEPLVASAAERQKELRQRRATIAEIEADRKRLEPLLQKAESLAQAETRIAERQKQLDDANLRAEALRAEIEATATLEQPDDPAKVDAMLRRNESDLHSEEAAIAVCEARLADANASAERLTKKNEERVALEADLADWNRLADDLGRDGVQSLEIDAAGPEMTEIVNDMLRACVGTRWTVSIEASHASSDGKKTLEGCDVRIIDSEKGREGLAQTLSGGELVIVNEACSLGLEMLSCRRSGSKNHTIIRDESGSALDPEMASAYIAMLRRAAKEVNAAHVIFVSHVKEVQDLADSKIEIRDGGAFLENALSVAA